MQIFSNLQKIEQQNSNFLTQKFAHNEKKNSSFFSHHKRTKQIDRHKSERPLAFSDFFSPVKMWPELKKKKKVFFFFFSKVTLS